MKITLVAAFITIAGYGVYTNQKSESMSDLALSNVEALAKPQEIFNIAFFCHRHSLCISFKAIEEY